MIPGTGSVPRESVERLAHRRSEAALSEQDLVAERDSGRGGCALSVKPRSHGLFPTSVR